MRRNCIIAVMAACVMVSCEKAPPTDVVVRNPATPKTLIDFRYNSLEAAGKAAVDRYDGCVFIFFYRTDNSNHSPIVEGAFNMPRLANYVNENFA